MSIGIQYFKNKHYQGFENCEETMELTNKTYNLLYALNRKFSAEGIKENGNDLEVS